MFAGNHTQEEIIKAAAQAGAEAALKTFADERKKEKQKRRDKRLKNTKLLLTNYRNFKEHSTKAIYDAEHSEDVIEIMDLMWDPNNRSEQLVESIKRSAVRTNIIMAHIENMLNTYCELCEKSKNPADKRKYNVLYERYISDEKYTIDEIASHHNIDPRTVYLDIEAATNVMAVLIFGVDYILGDKGSN